MHTSNPFCFLQARIEGTIEELPEPEVNAYFSGEPLMAKIRAVVCHQSRVVHDDRAALQSEMDRVWREVQMDGVTLSRPHSFQGYLLRPNMIEFYKGKKNSINDRIRFKKTTSDGCNEEDGVFPGENGWFYERLEP
jgi:pyridoxamine 5'-phosphate oxidase